MDPNRALGGLTPLVSGVGLVAEFWEPTGAAQINVEEVNKRAVRVAMSFMVLLVRGNGCAPKVRVQGKELPSLQR